jgi:quinol monooxygenase YgiN
MQAGIQLLSKFPIENRREYIRSFKNLPEFDGCRKNCSYSRLFEDVGEINSFLWVEFWRNENSMEAYLQSDRFKTIMGAIETLGELIYFNKFQFQNNQQQRQSRESS